MCVCCVRASVASVRLCVCASVHLSVCASVRLACQYMSTQARCMACLGYADADNAAVRAQDECCSAVSPLSAPLSFTSTLAAITAPVILLPVPDILSPFRTMTASVDVNDNV